MFTGIIQTKGRLKKTDSKVFCFVADELFFLGVNVGDSVAVNGVCLTVTQISNKKEPCHCFCADVSQETLTCSILGNLKVGNEVNLEKALKLNQGIDGHLVSGHVDGVAKVVDKFAEGESTCFRISAPKNLVKYIARKGSVCINGVSLTVNAIQAQVFDVNIVPHTLNTTTLGRLNVDDLLNLEVDIIARHIEQLLKNKL